MSSDPGWWARRLGQQDAPALAHYPEYQPPQAMNQQQTKYISPQREPQITTENLFEMTHYWTGGEAHAKERTACPNCGGGHFYSRSSGVSRGPAPAPLCYDCGYNGMFQQGDPANWNAGG
jgi:hypothetical protein